MALKLVLNSCSNIPRPPRKLEVNNPPLQEILTPKVLKFAPCFTPSPHKLNLRYQIGHLEQEFTELKQFTSLERAYDCSKETDINKNLVEQLRLAQEQLKVKTKEHWELVYEKLNKEVVCSQCYKMENPR